MHGEGDLPQQVKITRLRCSGGSRSFACPFKLIRDFLATRPMYVTDKEPLFIFRDQTPVKPQNMREVLCKSLIHLRFNASLYGTHSLRIG